MTFIWWTDQCACEAIGPVLPKKDFPKWLRDQYESRVGRNGRGRLWSAKQFESASIADCIAAFDAFTPMSRWLENSFGGILIDETQAKNLRRRGYAGLLTDLQLNQIGGK